jgi:hypothetical protein
MKEVKESKFRSGVNICMGLPVPIVSRQYAWWLSGSVLLL